MLNLGIVALAVTLASCAIQRAEIAQDARAQMVGMSKEQVLACMGAPVSKAAEGATVGLQLWRRDDRGNRVLRSIRWHRRFRQPLLQDQYRFRRRTSVCRELHRANRGSPHSRRAMRLRNQSLR
jgi:hypothetical protein